MAKPTKGTPKERWIKGNISLIKHSTFLYEVEIYKYSPCLYNLEDSKYLTSDTFVKDSSKMFTKDGTKFRRVVTLIGAPEEWLLSNKFKHTIIQ